MTPEELGLFVDFLKLEFPEYIVGEEEMFVLPEDMPEEVFFKKLEDKFEQDDYLQFTLFIREFKNESLKALIYFP